MLWLECFPAETFISHALYLGGKKTKIPTLATSGTAMAYWECNALLRLSKNKTNLTNLLRSIKNKVKKKNNFWKMFSFLQAKTNTLKEIYIIFNVHIFTVSFLQEEIEQSPVFLRRYYMTSWHCSFLLFVSSHHFFDLCNGLSWVESLSKYDKHSKKGNFHHVSQGEAHYYTSG